MERPLSEIIDISKYRNVCCLLMMLLVTHTGHARIIINQNNQYLQFVVHQPWMSHQHWETVQKTSTVQV